MSSKRPKACEGQLMLASREHTFAQNQPVSYNFLRSILDQPEIKQTKNLSVDKFYKNCLSLIPSNEKVFWVSHSKNALNSADINGEEITVSLENSELEEMSDILQI